MGIYSDQASRWLIQPAGLAESVQSLQVLDHLHILVPGGRENGRHFHGCECGTLTKDQAPFDQSSPPLFGHYPVEDQRILSRGKKCHMGFVGQHAMIHKLLFGVGDVGWIADDQIQPGEV